MIVNICWLVNFGVSMCESPLEKVAYKSVLISTVVSSIFVVYEMVS